jgi:hypothetical protein
VRIIGQIAVLVVLVQATGAGLEAVLAEGRRGGVFDGLEMVRVRVGCDFQVVDRADAPGMASLPRFIMVRDAIPFHSFRINALFGQTYNCCSRPRKPAERCPEEVSSSDAGGG